MKHDLSLLGKRATYIRYDAQGKDFVFGEARVHAVFVDPDNRLSANLKDDAGASFNVELACLNPTDDFIARFKADMAKILAMSDDGNKAVEVLVQDWNEKIEVHKTELYGPQLAPDA